MSKLELNEQEYLRSLTKDFTPAEMAEVYNNAHKKSYFELMEAATRIKESKEEGAADKQASRGVAAPIAMGQASTERVGEGSGLADQLNIKTETEIIDLTSDDEDRDGTLAAPKPKEFTFPPAKTTIREGPGSQAAILVRYHRLARSIVSFRLKDKSTRRELISHCWALEQDATDLESKFPTIDRLRAFIRKHQHTIIKHNPEVANVIYAVKEQRNTTACGRKVPRVPLSTGSSTYVPSGRKRKRHESESSAESSELSSLDGDESDQGTPPQLDQENIKGVARAERLMAYAKSYQGYSSGIKLHFYQWVVTQDLVAQQHAPKRLSDIFKTTDAVVGFLFSQRYQGTIDLSRYPKLDKLLYGPGGSGPVTGQSGGRGESIKSAGLVDEQL